MKRTLTLILAATTLLLTGCATTISSNVLSVGQWPAEMADKSFVFTMPKTDTIEYRQAENLVRDQLRRQGMRDVADGAQARLAVTLDLRTQARDVRTIYPVAYDPFLMPGFGWRHRGFHRGFYPYGWGYSPFMYGPYYEERITTTYFRQLRVTINQQGGGKLYETTVENTSRTADGMKVLPAMVISAFEGFPAPSGVVRRVDVKTE